MAIPMNPPQAKPRCQMPLQTYTTFFSKHEIGKWYRLEDSDLPGDDPKNRRTLLVNAASRSGFAMRSTLQHSQTYFMPMGVCTEVTHG